LLLLFVALVSVIVSIVLSNFVLYSRRQPVVRTPAEVGLDCEEVEFPSSDGLTLRGWYIPAPPGDASAGDRPRVIILTHPMFFNRHGFVVRSQGWLRLFKTDVDLLKTAAALQHAGYAVLTFDFRNHGESAPGLCGVGLIEYQDVLGAVAYVNGRHSPHLPQIGFVSFCMGANATMVALSADPGHLENVRFLVAIQPVSALVFFRSYLKDVYTPLSLYLIPLVDRLVQWRGGFGLQEMSPLEHARNIHVPTLYVQAREDPWTELSDIEGFHEATAGPKALWLIEGEMDRFDTYNYVGDHPERILAFAREHFAAEADSSPSAA
jgi:pimeloyl-ACP methyl ester carboxylesterase